ncbi:Solute carrier family 35 member SLC35F1/F2/F6 [Ostreococcus tauri]|uniref:Solute carrier family 35 member SLC35F1/F2/F6 n=1 Tax=Ostreococcus tauri TaxID=70448 RepID=A0A090M294_OSTTA|nr:Solute carrier family 35 member SLC35F1/F2/F6 [Ostreococcus tauri]CEF98321.1 Solute carrier family 35 member SLC35F1/F2/F6 [Ostreococcus tauri]|eukprot:XP_022839206.1 Solute carrier family 35 member SLC35F1/F2/F6 [Ostreococcus tauri]
MSLERARGTGADARASTSGSATARARARGTGVALAQACAFVNACSAAASYALERRGVSLPSWQTFYAYACVACAFAPGYAMRTARGGGGANRARVGRYAALALLDVEANYCVTRAFEYTSMTSVSLLDSATIPFAMILSVYALGARYGKGHVAGGALAFAGLVVLVLGDAMPSARTSGGDGSNVPLGDFLAVVAAALYATSNVLNEGFLRDADKVEILAHIGVFGTVISGTQSAVLEGMKFSQLKVLGAAGAGLFALYALSLLVLYTFAMDVLELCGASAFNVSMLASDVWSVVIRLIFFNGFSSVSAFVSFLFAFAFVASGIIIFALAGDPAGAQPQSSADEASSLGARIRRLFVPEARRGAPYVHMDVSDDDDMCDVELTPVHG